MESWEARYQAGLKFLVDGKYLQAQEEFKAFLGSNPKSVEAHNALGISYQKANELELARKSFQKAIDLNPSFAEAQTNLGLNSVLRSDTEQAFRELERSLELNAQQPLVLFNLGVLAQQSGEPRSAATYLEKALALQPHDATILYNLISAYLASGQARPALEKADRLLALQSADSGLYLQTGELLSKYGYPAQAVKFYELAKRETRGASGARKIQDDFDKLLADANTQFQQDAKAVAELERLVKSSPNEAVNYFKLGLMLTKLGDFSRCFDLLTRAVKRFPHSPEIRLGYALACYFTGRNDLAEQAYLRLVQMQPQSDQSHFALGNFYADLGRLEEAAASFQRAVRRNPEN
jgi:tetratricopeptide (TPR) repeat protein